MTVGESVRERLETLNLFERARAEAPARRAPRGEAEALAADLRRTVAGEVRFDAGSRALYATDLSIYRQVPIGVVVPRDADDVAATVAACRSRGTPILGRGCGTSLAGQTCNVAVVIDFSKYMNRILALDPDGRRARVQPGVINDRLRDAAEAYHLTLAPDPATHEYCTLGGMIGNNSCGVHSVMGGKTVDNVEELEVLTYDGTRMRVGATSDEMFDLIVRGGGRRGEIYAALRTLRDRYAEEVRRRYPKIPRRVSGYNLDELLPENGFHVARALVGSESTCALTLAATVRLIPSPPHRALLVVGYPDLGSAGDEVAEIRSYGPIGLEAFHCHVIENMRRKGDPTKGARLLPEGRAWLLAEFGGEAPSEAVSRAEDAFARLRQGGSRHGDARVIADPGEQGAVWYIRESGVGASRVPHVEDAWPSWEDSAVPPARLGDYLRDFTALLDRYGYKYSIYGHFGDGCIHSRITFDLKTAAGIRRFRSYMEDAADLVLRYGGSLSGEHGDGQARGELLPKMFGPELIQAFREFKSIWDPHWRMNPGKVVDPYPLDSNLRLGTDHRPPRLETHFKFPDDGGSFALATERCFGVGKCRSLDGETMCPSFKATREEMHSTRGRAHLLFEMLRGDPLRKGWRDEHVREALDLCLQCKGCKNDCPVSVDIATYKAEFLSHYYEGRLRPAAAYAMGLVFRWAPLAMQAPGVVNAALRAPALGDAVKSAIGVAAERRLPSFAPETFQRWFRRRARRPEDDLRPEDDRRPRVVLWPDTFNNYFRTRTAQAAVEVLEAAGYRVEVPEQRLCCGRPLYDYGMLDLAKRKLRQATDALRPAIRAGIPVVGLEPSCVAVFRDELVNLFPDDEDARRLSRQCVTLSELLMRRDGYRPPRLERKAVVHAHCHHKAVLDADAQADLLRAMGLEFEPLDSGCCGQAGSFGYEHYDVSMAIGERVLLPAVRKAPIDALIIADGFSCREQIEHGSERRALHPAEVLRMALREGPDGAAEARPERRCAQPAAEPTAAEVGAVAAAGVLAAAALLWIVRSRSGDRVSRRSR